MNMLVRRPKNDDRYIVVKGLHATIECKRIDHVVVERGGLVRLGENSHIGTMSVSKGAVLCNDKPTDAEQRP